MGTLILALVTIAIVIKVVAKVLDLLATPLHAVYTLTR